MTVLLDANVLIALMISEHVHHDAAEDWLSDVKSFASCPITEGSLVRMLLREGQSADTAKTVVTALAKDKRHRFWPDDLPYSDVDMSGILGHRQVTDGYLAQLARKHKGRLATFDQGLAQVHSDVVDLVASTLQPLAPLVVGEVLVEGVGEPVAGGLVEVGEGDLEVAAVLIPHQPGFVQQHALRGQIGDPIYVDDRL